VFVALIAFTLGADTPDAPLNDHATFLFEQYGGAAPVGDSFVADDAFQLWWGYASLPGFRLLGKNVYLAVEYDVLRRDMRLGGEALGSKFLQRYGLFGGITLFRTGKQRGSLLIGTGVSSDCVDPGIDMLYGHFIYDHHFILSDRLEVGLGILFPYNFGETRNPVVNLLPTVLWTIREGTFLHVAWDALELRQWLGDRLVFVADTRYDLSFYRLAGSTTVEFETVGAGGGCDVRLWGDWYVRLRYTKILLKNERITRRGVEVVSNRGSNGHAVRLLVAYAK
jgi:hypothetical protein